MSTMPDSEAKEHPGSTFTFSPSHFLICKEPERQRGQSVQAVTQRGQEPRLGLTCLTASPANLHTWIYNLILQGKTEAHRCSIPWAQSVG